MNRAALLLAMLLLAPAQAVFADDALLKALRAGGQVLFIRHASTVPGVGDPENFRLDVCATQRNLSPAGRDEAKRLGAFLLREKVPVERVVSSPWCRCVDTAQLAFGRLDERWAALGNLFGRPERRARQVGELRPRIGAFRGRGNLVLVSHGSTALALAGVSPAQGELVVLTPLGNGEFRVAGRLRAPQ